MKDDFKIITAAFEQAGIDVHTAEYSITEYSLNTDLSFKFNNKQEFLEFLNIPETGENARREKVEAVFIEQGIDADNFFYVNFYQPKVVEM